LVSLTPATRPGHSQPGRRLIVASNRGPLEHYLTDAGSIRQRQAGGGVAVALRGVAAKTELTWIAAACSFADQIVARTGRQVPIGGTSTLRLIALEQEVYEPFYQAFCNPLLWFVQHSLSDSLSPVHTGEAAVPSWRTGYVPANRSFADSVCDEIERAGGNASVMLHDYHLYLTARMIRARHHDVPIQQFIHIPWPHPEAWAALPACIVRQICLGLLGNDSLAFQDDQSTENFKATCAAYLEDEIEASPSSPYVRHKQGQTFVWTNPISVDVAELNAVPLPDVEDASPLKTILRVDRLDPSKNVMRGFAAYEQLLQRRSDLHGKVRFVACLVPSRTGIAEYDGYAAETLSLVESINRRYGTSSWQPITLVLGNDRPRALAWMSRYDCLLVNSVADGMNLVSKEGSVLNRRNGTLVLSRSAGAHRELAPGALSIDPLNVEETSAALEQALDMSQAERQVRMSRLRFAINGYQLSDWLRALLKDLELTAHEKSLTAGLPSN
jgi:trehalose 6-phosphate synthase